MSGLGGGVGRPGLGMDLEGQVLEDDPDGVAVLLLDLRERRPDAIAERTLEVRPLDDRDLRVALAADRRVAQLDLVLAGRIGSRAVGSDVRRARPRRGRFSSASVARAICAVARSRESATKKLPPITDKLTRTAAMMIDRPFEDSDTPILPDPTRDRSETERMVRPRADSIDPSPSAEGGRAGVKAAGGRTDQAGDALPGHDPAVQARRRQARRHEEPDEHEGRMARERGRTGVGCTGPAREPPDVAAARRARHPEIPRRIVDPDAGERAHADRQGVVLDEGPGRACIRRSRSRRC